MRGAIVALFVLLAVPPGAAQGASVASSEPVVEYREARSDVRGLTGSMLTIDRSGQAIVQPIPFAPGSKTMRTQLTCEELVELPRALKEEFAEFQPSYGRKRAVKKDEISIVSRWDQPEKRVVWRNPPSSPKPPSGWWRIVGKLDTIKRRAEEPKHSAARLKDSIVEYEQSSSGFAGTFFSVLAIDKSGSAVLTGKRWQGTGHTQLTPDELAALLRAIEEAKFVEFQQCYGQYAMVNPHNSSIVYRWNAHEKQVMWMSPPSDPKPPEGWSRIVEILDRIWTRGEANAVKP